MRVILFIFLLFFGVTSANANPGSFVSKQVYQLLIDVEKLINEEQYKEAHARFSAFSRGQSGINDYEQALIDQSLGVLYARTENYLEAMSSFENALRLNQLPDGLEQQTLYNLAQIYLFRERYQQAIKLIQENLLPADKDVSPKICFMLANAYAGLDDSRQALVWSKRSLQNVSAGTPESYFALAVNLHLTLEQYADAEKRLQQVLERVPGRAVYWRQLAAVRLELDNQQQALAALELGYLQGILDEQRDIVQLAGLYINLGLPYKAATVIEENLKNGVIKADQKVYKLLAAAWNNAREYTRAIVPLTKAAELSEDGELFLQLTHLYVEEEDWLAAQSAIKQALDKGGIKKPHEACFIQGVIYTNLGHYENAENIFIGCLDFDDIRDQVIEWLEFLGANNS